MTWTNDSIRHLEAQSIRDFVESCAGYLTGRVLDLGCGLSPYRSIIERVGGDYTGYDRVRFPANVSGEDVGAPFDWADRFDAVLVNQVFQYQEDLWSLLDQVFRLLRHRGALIVTGPTTWPIVEAEDLVRLTPAGVRHELTRLGFDVESVGARAPLRVGDIEFFLGYEAVAFRPESLIYVLRQPDSGEPRYVGKTTQALSQRLRMHMREARSGKRSKLWNWLRSLDVPPTIQPLEIEPSDVDAAERRWIGQFRNDGVRLCNMTNGGDGQKRGYRHSAVEIERRRAYRHSPESRAKISATNTGRKRSPEFREKMATIARARPSVVSDDAVREIRRSAESLSVLGRRFGVSPSYIHQIKKGTARSHVI